MCDGEGDRHSIDPRLVDLERAAREIEPDLGSDCLGRGRFGLRLTPEGRVLR